MILIKIQFESRLHFIDIIAYHCIKEANVYGLENIKVAVKNPKIWLTFFSTLEHKGFL